ncbi:MAG: hypothetical protein HGB22_06950 [Chlorobiaceae bacterium]|nr:hypothetical protein [Chlorobiaceae bacterium]
MKQNRMKISPFANESESLNIGGLSIENRQDRVSIYGSIDITRDRQGLDHARMLKTLFDDILAALDSAPLPDKISIEPAENVENPFED